MLHVSLSLLKILKHQNLERVIHKNLERVNVVMCTAEQVHPKYRQHYQPPESSSDVEALTIQD